MSQASFGQASIRRHIRCNRLDYGMHGQVVDVPAAWLTTADVAAQAMAQRDRPLAEPT